MSSDDLLERKLISHRRALASDAVAVERFINAIEDQIKTADPVEIQPLVDYVRDVQNTGRKNTTAVQALIDDQRLLKSKLSDDEKAVLRAWKQSPQSTINEIMGKFREGLRAEDRKLVNEWLATLAETERSLVVTGLLIGIDVDAGLFLAVNLYRAYLAGMSKAKILSALRISQVYCGLPAYVAAAKTLNELEKIIIDSPDDAQPASIVNLLVKRFDTSL
jgi:alkylhydroperoxidase/carboxymuconolactone decarboxylase family protein YurZ